MNLIDLIEKNARLYSNSEAFVEVKPVSKIRKQITWSLFNERTNRIANGLIEKKITKGRKVALLGKNSINWLEAFFGIMKTGAWVIPLNFRFTEEEIKYCAGIGEPSCIFFDEEYTGIIERLRPELTTVKHFVRMGSPSSADVEDLEASINQSSPQPPEVEINDEDGCALYFTSGTTGPPKAVLHANRSLTVAAITEATDQVRTCKDSFLMLPPLYHLAIGHLLGGLIVGSKNVLLTEQIKPKYVFETVSNEKISMVFLLMPWALDILEALGKGEIKTKDYDLSHWRLMYTGAQPIPPSLVKKWKGYFPTMAYSNTYGLSEAGGPGIVYLATENERKVGAIGKPGLIWDARVVDKGGKDVPVGQVGEIIVKGRGIMKEYYKNPEATSKAIRNGWLYTGDLAKLDEEGFIYIVDRKKDLVISGGENIYPVEIEAIIQKHPKVRDVAVIGVADQRLGEAVAAVIEAVSGEVLTGEEMIAFCEENLPRYKRPRHFIFSHVPRSATGKIQKQSLRDAYAKNT
jgi:long-chain acyl-CoA synthetase